jgi:hypothetical protein
MLTVVMEVHTLDVHDPFTRPHARPVLHISQYLLLRYYLFGAVKSTDVSTCCGLASPVILKVPSSDPAQANHPLSSLQFVLCM